MSDESTPPPASGVDRLEAEPREAGQGDVRRGRMVLALREVERARVSRPSSLDLALALCEAADASEEAGERARAASLFKEAFGLYASLPPSAAWLEGYALGALARGLSRHGAESEAETVYRWMIGLCEAEAPPDDDEPTPTGHPELDAAARRRARIWEQQHHVPALVGCGELLERQGRFHEAEALYRRACSVELGARARDGARDFGLAWSMLRVCLACARQGKVGEAKRLVAQALAEASRVGHGGSRIVADYLADMAKVFRAAGHPEEAPPLEAGAASRYRVAASMAAGRGDEAARVRFEDLARELGELGERR